MSDRRLSPPLSVSGDASAPLRFRDRQSGEMVADPLEPTVTAALEAARRCAVGLSELDAALRIDGSTTASGRVLAIRRAAEKSAPAAAGKLDQARSKLVDTLAELDRQTGCPPFDPSLAVLLPEIRAALRGMSEGARQEALAAAQADGDLTVLSAALSAPALASGVGRDRLEMIRSTYRATNHPEAVARMSRLEAAIKALDTAAASFGGFIERAVTAGEHAEVAAGRVAAASAAFADGEA